MPGQERLRQMKLQIEIYQRRGRNIHVVLRGRAGGEASFDDSDVFAKYTEVCQEFARRHAPLPEAFATAFDAKGESYMAPPVSR